MILVLSSFAVTGFFARRSGQNGDRCVHHLQYRACSGTRSCGNERVADFRRRDKPGRGILGYSSSSSSGFSCGLSPGDSCGNCRPCFKPPDFSASGWSRDGGGVRRGPFRGANLAEGEGREEGESSGACRGEIREWGGLLGRGETAGGAVGGAGGDTLGRADGETAGEAAGCLGDGADNAATDGVGLVLCRFNENGEVLARAFSMLAAVRMSPPLNVPSVFVVGNVAVGAWPTG